MLSHAGTRVLETHRLVLRRFEEKDAAAMFAWAGDSQVTRFLRFATHKSAEDSLAVLRQWQEAYRCPDFYEWADYGKGDLAPRRIHRSQRLKRA